MVSTFNDRVDGISTSTAVKAPVRAGTTANIALTGIQTIDGVALAVEDRVLVKNQTDAIANGIYVVKTGLWERAKDWDGARDVRQGTVVLVANGTAQTDSFWHVATADPVEPGTTAVTFTKGFATIPGAANPGDDGKVLTPLAGILAWNDYINGSLKIGGTGSPSVRLHVVDTVTGALLTLESTSAVATFGPNINLYRNSASPAASDNLGSVEFEGNDSTPNRQTYARVRAVILDPLAGARASKVLIQTLVAGVFATPINFGAGVWTDGATGGDKGANTINASEYYRNNVLMPNLAADQSWTGSQRSTFVALTDAATVLVDFATEQNMYVTVTADRTIGQPSNQVDGQSGFLVVEQDGTGGRTTSFHADWDFGADGVPTPDTAANKKMLIAYIVDWDTVVQARYIGDF